MRPVPRGTGRERQRSPSEAGLEQDLNGECRTGKSPAGWGISEHGGPDLGTGLIVAGTERRLWWPHRMEGLGPESAGLVEAMRVQSGEAHV